MIEIKRKNWPVCVVLSLFEVEVEVEEEVEVEVCSEIPIFGEMFWYFLFCTTWNKIIIKA